METINYEIKRFIYLINTSLQKALFVLPHTARWERMNGVLSITGMMHEAES